MENYEREREREREWQKIANAIERIAYCSTRLRVRCHECKERKREGNREDRYGERRRIRIGERKK